MTPIVATFLWLVDKFGKDAIESGVQLGWGIACVVSFLFIPIVTSALNSLFWLGELSPVVVKFLGLLDSGVAQAVQGIPSKNPRVGLPDYLLVSWLFICSASAVSLLRCFRYHNFYSEVIRRYYQLARIDALEDDDDSYLVEGKDRWNYRTESKTSCW